LLIVSYDKKSDHFCGRVTLSGEEKKIVSISIPPDACGNRGPGQYDDPAIPETIEIMMISDHDDLYRDIWRCTTVDELISKLEKIRDNIRDEDEDEE